LFYILCVLFYSLTQCIVGFLATLEIILLLFSCLSDISIQIWNHLLYIGPDCVYILILNLNLLGNSLSQRCHILQHLTTFLHADIQNFELLINIFIFLIDLPWQLLYFFLLLLKAPIYTCKYTGLEYFWIILDHKCDLLYFLLGGCLVKFQFINGAWTFQYSFLKCT